MKPLNKLKMIRARKQLSIIQSAYIPWKGFFDLVNRCDEYVDSRIQFSSPKVTGTTVIGSKRTVGLLGLRFRLKPQDGSNNEFKT